MKTNQKYFLLSVATIVAVLGLSIGLASSAQTTTPLTCSVGVSSVGVNQPVTLTATGGNGTSYQWSGPSINSTNSSNTTGSQFTVSYPNAGNYMVNVTSGNSSASCNVNVVAASTIPGATTFSGNLVCSPPTQNVTLGQTATFSASGGNGSYTWSSPDLTITNPNGTGFSASYASTGVKTMTVSSNGLSTTCTVNVLAATPGAPASTPALPNTGGGYGQQ